MKTIKTEILTKRLKSKVTYEDFFNENKQAIKADSFTVMLRKYIGASDLEVSEIIQRSQIAKTYAYQIINGSKNPSRDKILQLTLALNLELEEANMLLRSAQYKNLYVKDQRDSIVMYCLLNPSDQAVQEANEMLYDHDLKTF